MGQYYQFINRTRNEIAFTDDKTHDSGFGWEKYQPKPVPPRKLESDDTTGA